MFKNLYVWKCCKCHWQAQHIKSWLDTSLSNPFNDLCMFNYECSKHIEKACLHCFYYGMREHHTHWCLFSPCPQPKHDYKLYSQYLDIVVRPSAISSPQCVHVIRQDIPTFTALISVLCSAGSIIVMVKIQKFSMFIGTVMLSVHVLGDVKL